MAKMREGPAKTSLKQKALRVLKQRKQWVIENNTFYIWNEISLQGSKKKCWASIFYSWLSLPLHSKHVAQLFIPVITAIFQNYGTAI